MSLQTWAIKIDSSLEPRVFELFLDEYQVELYDDVINSLGLTEPKVFNYFNFASEIKEEPGYLHSNALSIYLQISDKVFKQKRTVYDILMMAGDVGGLNDFLIIAMAAIFGTFSHSFLQATLVKKLFLTTLIQPS